VLTDVHEVDEIDAAAAAVDVCKRRHSCAARPISSAPCAAAGKPVNIKKGQFLAPGDMKNVVEKRATPLPQPSG
jgi:2-dehydro-3-deoxyphosphooctonate aldolase (KDO 8-P synthase)